jgi:hypothetical protein
MSSFAEFKKKQAELSDAVKNMAKKPNKSYQDERFWRFTKDASGNANATIRFLPQQDPSKSPVLLTYKHGFQEEGRWFIEECPVTIGEKCPVCEQSSTLWATDEETARKYWRNKQYIANILVIDDEGNPENNGKTFLFQFGKIVYDKIMEVVQPEDEDEEPINVFDFDEGANFKLKIVQKAGFNNYDKSKFLSKTSALENQEEIFDSLVDLDEFVDPEKFKSYDEILKKFSNVVNYTAPVQKQSASDEGKSSENADKETPKKFEFHEDDVLEDNEEGDEIDFDSLLSDDED